MAAKRRVAEGKVQEVILQKQLCLQLPPVGLGQMVAMELQLQWDLTHQLLPATQQGQTSRYSLPVKRQSGVLKFGIDRI